MDNPLRKAVSLYNDKKYELALKELLKCDYDLDDNTDLSYYLGLCYTRLEHYDEAVVFLEQVITTHPNVLYIYQCRMILCYIYAVTEQYKLAEFEIKRLIEDGYESAQVFSSYGYIEYQQGRTGRAIEYFREALNLDPEYPNALNSLGYILADENIDPEEALSYCIKANNLSSGHFPFLDSLGWAYHKTGDNVTAETILRDAYRRSGSNRIIAAHLKKVIDSSKN